MQNRARSVDRKEVGRKRRAWITESSGGSRVVLTHQSDKVCLVI